MNGGEFPDEPGVYQLHLLVGKPVTIAVGKLGEIEFAAGEYRYTGSAMGGLRARLARHFRSEKKLHWHIDYLLPHATIGSVSYIVTKARIECETHQRMLELNPSAEEIVGFGCSDCKCRSHLAWIRKGRGK